MSRQPTTNRPGRRGTATMILIAALVVAVSVMMITLKAFTARDQQTRVHLDVIQASSLVDSAISLVTTRLSADPDYEGETWEIAAGQLPREATAQVVIAPAENPSGRRFEITVTYHAHTDQTITRRHLLPSPPTRETSE